MQILDDDRVLNRLAGALVGSDAVQMALFDAAAEHQHGAGVGEVAVHAVMFQLVDRVRHVHLVTHLVAWFALDEHVAAELAGEHDERAIEQAAFLEVEHELRDRGVDLALHVGEACVAVLVGVPVEERHVLGCHLDEPRAGLDEPPRQQAAAPELAGVVNVVGLLFLE